MASPSTTSSSLPSRRLRSRQTRHFDFASPAGWDDYYQKQEQTQKQQLLRKETNGDKHDDDDDNTIDDDAIVEWHSSVALEDLAALVPLHADCLLVGCGNSELPGTILHDQAQRSLEKENLAQQPQQQQSSRLVLMDTSPTCLEQLQRRYSKSVAGNSPDIMQVEYLCGDATRLSDYFGSAATANDNDDDDTDVLSTRPFDVILDKGLCDAIWCGEGWNGPLERLFREAAKVIRSTTTTTTTQPGGYILVCYRLSASHKEFLTDVGQQVGFEWEFDLPPPLSNDRVSVSVASLVAVGPYRANPTM